MRDKGKGRSDPLESDSTPPGYPHSSSSALHPSYSEEKPRIQLDEPHSSTTKALPPIYDPQPNGTYSFPDLLSDDAPAPPFEDVEGMKPSEKDTEGKFELRLDITKKLPPLPDEATLKEESDIFEIGVDPHSSNCPPLNIVIFIVGSRGDVQPYIALALGLIKDAGHRVRLATHGEFRDFVLQANTHLKGYRGPSGEPLEGKLEFFDAGGDPRELMAYMVKNPGLMPGPSSLINGDISSKKRMTAEYIKGFYNSTFFPDRRNGPFAADAIISNPPAFAHIHVAQALGIPLHMSFTMPWLPTTAFQHPLVTVKDSNAEPGMTNYVSFAMADVLMWQGLGTLINKFRSSALGLSKLSTKEGPYLLYRMAVPWTYCWSQALIPKPKDWKKQVDIAGFYFLEGSTGFTPDDELAAFLKDGPPPIYIGFGSVPVKDPEGMTRAIFDGVRKAGVRALVSAGWGGLGGAEPPDSVFILTGNIPHDWLFAEGRVAAVCHHGGAGTTAIGLRNGLPTIVVPFFGDQQFWGDMISNAKAGPPPIPPKHLTAETLAEAIDYCYSDEAGKAAGIMGETIRAEDGVAQGVASFHKHLPLLHMRCDVDPSRVAVWWSAKLCLRLSAAVAGFLHTQALIDMKNLELLRSKEYEVMKHHTDPFTGGWQGVAHIVTTAFEGSAKLFYNPLRGFIDLTWGVHAAAWHAVYDIYEGFDNIPGLIGSDTRSKGKITDWKSGFREAAYGFGYGIWDGVTGLVTEPIVAVKEEGAKGLMTGVGRSVANLVARPTAGSLGIFMLPAQGIAQSIRATFRRTAEKVYRGPRTEISVAEAAKLSKEDQDRLGSTFYHLLSQTKARRKEHTQKRHRVFLTGEMLAGSSNRQKELSPGYEEPRTEPDDTSLREITSRSTLDEVDSQRPAGTLWSRQTSATGSSRTMPCSDQSRQAIGGLDMSHENIDVMRRLQLSETVDEIIGSDTASKKYRKKAELRQEEAAKRLAEMQKRAAKQEKKHLKARAKLEAKTDAAERKEQKEDAKEAKERLAREEARRRALAKLDKEHAEASAQAKFEVEQAMIEQKEAKGAEKWEAKMVKREEERVHREEKEEKLKQKFIREIAARQLKDKKTEQG